MTMVQFALTLLLVAVPYFFMALPMMSMWNKHTRLDCVMFMAWTAVGVLLWQGAWGMAGGMA